MSKILELMVINLICRKISKNSKVGKKEKISILLNTYINLNFILDDNIKFFKVFMIIIVVAK